MKGIFVVLCTVGLVAAEPPAPYSPSGWKPSGPAFELPQRGEAQNTQNQNYLPPVDPRNPSVPVNSYGVPDDQDVSVIGLPPPQEQLPIFQPSPINGQQYVGPAFNTDIKNLDKSFQQTQFQNQQEKARQFARQKQQENAANRLPSTNFPRQFVPRTTVNPTDTTFTSRPDSVRTTQSSTTESDLNEGETDDEINPAVAEKQKVSVEVSKQNIQEYPPELFLNPLAQLRLQNIQLGQYRSPFLVQAGQLETSQKQVSPGFDAQTHFAALPSIIAQQQLAQQQALIQGQQGITPNQAILVRGQQQANPGFLIQSPQQQPLNQYQPFVNGQYEPLVQSQFQGQNVILQPQVESQVQPNQYAQPNEPNEGDKDDQEDVDQQQPQSQVQYQQPQIVYQSRVQGFQPQPQFVNQPQAVYQPQAEGVLQQPQMFQSQPGVYQPQAEVAYQQPQIVYQQGFPAQGQVPANDYQMQQQQQNFILAQGQLVNYPAQDLNQYYQLQQQFGEPAKQVQGEGQIPLQSGFDVDQQGNGLDKNKDNDEEDNTKDGDSIATAVATAFGARTQPRVYMQYGVPVSRPQDGVTTEASTQEETTAEDGPAVAEATAVARGGRRKSAKLRSRRIRPVFTLDRSGHLVLAQDQ